MQAAHVRLSFDQKRPEDLVTLKDGKTLPLPLDEAIERMGFLRTLFKHDTPEDFAREYDETIESEIASLDKKYDLPFVPHSDNSIISKKEGSEDPIISIMNLNLFKAVSISLDHILELKKDEESCKKLRRFRTFTRYIYEKKVNRILKMMC